MQRIRHKKREWIWPAAAVLLVSLHFWSPKTGVGIRHDSYSVLAEGKKAFFELLQNDPERQGLRVSRNLEPLARSIRPSRFRNTVNNDPQPCLCLLGPARYPNEAEWDLLLDWVKRGGTIVIAARDEKPEFEIKKLGIRVRRIRKRIDADSDQIRTTLVRSNDLQLLWRSNAQIIVKGRAETLVRANNSRQAVLKYHGKGRVVVVASEFIFTNQSLNWADHSNAVWALRLVERGMQGSKVVFDESLNISGTPKVVGLLLNPLFKPITVQLLLALVLFGWWRSRRFGPKLPGSMPARHNIVDHTNSVGQLHYKSRDNAAALRSYLRQFFSELKLKSFKGREDRVIEPIAVRLGKSTKSIRTLFQSAAKAARSKEIDRKTAARYIRQLARVRRAAQSRGRLTRAKRRKSA